MLKKITLYLYFSFAARDLYYLTKNMLSSSVIQKNSVTLSETNVVICFCYTILSKSNFIMLLI